tara:strand:+ start:536 stop:694 length:159 start_codon:yes stop_codon:yes gene_type:complete
MKNMLFNPVFLFLASLILPVAAFEAVIAQNTTAADILLGLFAVIMALIILRK